MHAATPIHSPQAHLVSQQAAAVLVAAQAHDALVQERDALALVRAQVAANIRVYHLYTARQPYSSSAATGQGVAGVPVRAVVCV